MNRDTPSRGSKTRCACCGHEFDPREFGDDFWEGRLDDYCSVCSLTRCDWRIDSCGRALAGNVWDQAFTGIAYGLRNALAWLRRIVDA